MSLSKEDKVLSLSEIEIKINQTEEILKSLFEELKEQKGSQFSKNVLSKKKDSIIQDLFHLHQLKHSIEKWENTTQHIQALSLLSIKRTSTKRDRVSKWTIAVEYNQRTVTFFIQRPAEQSEEDLIHHLFKCYTLDDIMELDISLLLSQRKDT